MTHTVTAFGRSWSHQQFHGLVVRLMDDGWLVHMKNNDGSNYIAVIFRVTNAYCGHGSTVWTALCDAVERMEK